MHAKQLSALHKKVWESQLSCITYPTFDIRVIAAEYFRAVQEILDFMEVYSRKTKLLF